MSLKTVWAPRDTRARFRPPETTAPFDRLALAKHLAAAGYVYDPAEPVLQFAGGLANRNYLIHLDGAPAVLRRPPSGDLPPGAHDMAREHRLLSALSKALPLAPDSRHFCADASVLGAPFQIIEHREGEVLTGSSLPADLPDDAPSRLSRMIVETLAQIHAVDAEACGLGQLGRPEGFISRTIEGWRARGARVAEGRAAKQLIAEIAAKLAAHRYEDRAPTLVHMDFKLDNIILEPKTLTPVAVVDWDMGTRGDPLFDLATLLSYWCEPHEIVVFGELDQMPTALPGFWSRAQAAEAYGKVTGQDLRDLPILNVLALLRLGVVFLQLHDQYRSGAVTNPRYATFDRSALKVLAHAHGQLHATGKI